MKVPSSDLALISYNYDEMIIMPVKLFLPQQLIKNLATESVCTRGLKLFFCGTSKLYIGCRERAKGY